MILIKEKAKKDLLKTLGFKRSFLLYRKDRRWRSVELKIARTKAGMTNKRLSV